MGTPTPRQRIIMRNLPCLSRTPGSTTPMVRSLPKEVFLYKWWLVRAAGASNKNDLHVAGFTSSRRQVTEIFHSAAIVKRHGIVTLESVDGITISISGFINSFRTIENGFSKEVCDKFLLGFPYNWEEFATASDRVSPSEASPQLSGTLSSSKYMLPVAFEDLPAVAIQDLLMSIPEDSENSMLNIVVENIRKSYAGSSCSGGKMSDCLKEDASNGMKYSFTEENQTGNVANAVKHGHTVINAEPEITSSLEGRVEILQNKKDDIIALCAAVRENMNSASEKPLDGSCVDSDANFNLAGAGVRENMNSTSEKCLEGIRFNAHASKTNTETISGKEGHLGSLVADSNVTKNEVPESEGNSKDLSVEYVVQQSCNKNSKINVQKKKRGRPTANDKEGLLGSLVEVSNTNKNEKPESEGNSEDVSVEYVVPQSCNKSNKIDVQQKKSSRLREKDTSRMRVTRSMKRQRKISFRDTSAMPDEVTPLSRCQVSSTRELSKPQNEILLLTYQGESTLRRSTRLQNKQHVRPYYRDDSS